MAIFGKFYHPYTFIALLSGLPLEFCNSGRAQKTRMMPLDPEAKARASGSERETERARPSKIIPVSERQ